MHRTIWQWILVGFLVCATACDPDSGSIAASKLPLINGTLSDASYQPAVGALVIMYPGRLTVRCTGTLVGHDRVLLAAHCFDNLSASLNLGFFRGPTTHIDVPESQIVPVASHLVHPSYTSSPPPDSIDNYNDIAVIRLAHPAGIPPAKMVRAADANNLVAVGKQVIVAGYGQTMLLDQSSSGTRHHGTTTINEVGTHEFRLDGNDLPNKCTGDSGGPTLADQDPGPDEDWRLIGVASRASEDCASGSIDTRVDAHLDWIHRQRGIICGSGLNQDCIDPPTEKLDETCGDHAECLSDLCAYNRCALPCSLFINNCPDGLSCGRVPGLSYGACLQPATRDAGPACEGGPGCDDQTEDGGGGGCSVSGATGGRMGLSMLLLLFLLRYHRRRGTLYLG
jgi:MYXO-CTERM domain-containing protein